MNTLLHQSKKRPFLGFGLGLRHDHYETILRDRPKVDWFEIITENFLVDGGKPLYYLDRIRENYPIVMHGVSLSIGGTDPFDLNYLKQVKALSERIEPAWISDHLCWTGVNELNMHDLMPLPYTNEAIDHVVSRIQIIQEFLDRRILIENVSSYLTFKQSEMSEWDFLATIAKRADCFLLLDVNNIYVSSINHAFSPLEYIHAMPSDRIYQIHLAGHSINGTHIIDTHDAPVIKEVWELYAETIQRFGAISTMIERDANIPDFYELFDELNHARIITENILEENVIA